jgi:uncharacterized protein YidB (DUF937 family)
MKDWRRGQLPCGGRLRSTARGSKQDIVRGMAALKYGLAALLSVLWAAGLIDQMHSWAATAKYMIISLLMVVVSLL